MTDNSTPSSQNKNALSSPYDKSYDAWPAINSFHLSGMTGYCVNHVHAFKSVNPY